LCLDLRLRLDLKQSCSPCQKISNGMWHATFTQGNQGDSALLVVGSQIANLILKLILVITYVLSAQMGHANPL
jgi:hypothetical protein